MLRGNDWNIAAFRVFNAPQVLNRDIILSFPVAVFESPLLPDVNSNLSGRDLARTVGEVRVRCSALRQYGMPKKTKIAFANPVIVDRPHSSPSFSATETPKMGYSSLSSSSTDLSSPPGAAPALPTPPSLLPQALLPSIPPFRREKRRPSSLCYLRALGALE